MTLNIEFCQILINCCNVWLLPQKATPKCYLKKKKTIFNKLFFRKEGLDNLLNR